MGLSVELLLILAFMVFMCAIARYAGGDDNYGH